MVRGPITVQRATTTADGYGGQDVSWATVYTIWPTYVSGKGGAEIEEKGRRISSERYVFDVRYGPTITAADRLIYGSVTMNIRSVQDRDGKRRRLTIEAEARHAT